jgi:ABC-type multidrug transport system fused ATPase/permease subunit
LTLSGGQRQRIAIARALLADPRVLVLDDATSSVDASTERHIKRALAEAMDGRTTFIVAHRPSTLALADEIVVLEHGRIAARGSHEQVLAQSRFYRELIADSPLVARASAAAAAAYGEGPDGAVRLPRSREEVGSR